MVIYTPSTPNVLADSLLRNISYYSFASIQMQPPLLTILPPPAGPPAESPGRLDISAIEPSVQRFCQNRLAPSTIKPAMKRYALTTLCINYNITKHFPLSEQLLVSFVPYVADQGLAPKTGVLSIGCKEYANVARPT